MFQRLDVPNIAYDLIPSGHPHVFQKGEYR